MEVFNLLYELFSLVCSLRFTSGCKIWKISFRIGKYNFDIHFFFTLMINHWFKKKKMKIKKERHEQNKKCSRVFNYLIGLHDFYVIELMKIMMKSRWCLKICYFFLLTNHFNSTYNFDLFLYKTYIDSEWLKKWIL